MEFLLSEQLERMLAGSDSHNCPIRPALAENFKMYVIPKPLSVDYEKVADCLPMAIRTTREVLR